MSVLNEGISPLVTVVVPAYNHEDYVVNCIKSVLDQYYPNIELIVINDGSTDSTDARIREFIGKGGKSFRYISKPNGGLIKTLKLGLKLSVGKYFCEIASDDMLLPGSIKKRVEYLEANPDLESVFADAFVIKDNTPATVRALGKKRVGHVSSKHTIEDFINGETIVMFPSGMHRKAVFDKLGGFDEDFKHCEDVFTRFQLVLRGKVGFLDEPVMYYRRHLTNVTIVLKLEAREEYIFALEKLAALVTTDHLREIVKNQLFKYYLKYFEIGRDNAISRETLEETLKKALRLGFPHPKALRALYNLAALRFFGKR